MLNTKIPKSMKKILYLLSVFLIISNCIGYFPPRTESYFYHRHLPLENIQNSYLSVKISERKSEKGVNVFKNKYYTGTLRLEYYEIFAQGLIEGELYSLPYPGQIDFHNPLNLKSVPKKYARNIFITGCNNIVPFPIGENNLIVTIYSKDPTVFYAFNRKIPINLHEDETFIVKVDMETYAEETEVIRTPSNIRSMLCK